MAIAIDTSTIGGDGVASFSHTCTGSNLVLIVWVASPNQDTTGATYNGVSMTRFRNGGALTDGLYGFYLLGPATGSNTVAVTGSTKLNVIALSYTGVKQSGFPDSQADNSLATSPSTVNTTVVASNCWLVDCAVDTGSASPPTTNRTNRKSGNFTNAPFASGGIVGGDSNGTVGTGSQGTTYTSSVAFFGICTLSIAPSIASGPTNLNTYNTNPKANIKSIDTNLIANVKSLNTNT